MLLTVSTLYLQPEDKLDHCEGHDNSMGVAMSEIIPGLFIGNICDAKDQEALHSNGITHIVTIHDHAKVQLENITYLSLHSPDNPSANISQYFKNAIDFIHKCRIQENRVLVHCIAGASRSVTITVAYLMSVTDYNWKDCLRAVKQARQVAKPNYGFQKQLQNFENTELEEVRNSIKETFPDTLRERDTAAIQELLDKYSHNTESNKVEEDLYPLPSDAFTASSGQPPL